jgi:hypothetical protein
VILAASDAMVQAVEGTLPSRLRFMRVMRGRALGVHLIGGQIGPSHRSYIPYDPCGRNGHLPCRCFSTRRLAIRCNAVEVAGRLLSSMHAPQGLSPPFVVLGLSKTSD